MLRAQAFGRDIEPTLEDGSLLYDITTSCLKVCWWWIHCFQLGECRDSNARQNWEVHPNTNMWFGFFLISFGLRLCCRCTARTRPHATRTQGSFAAAVRRGLYCLLLLMADWPAPRIDRAAARPAALRRCERHHAILAHEHATARPCTGACQGVSNQADQTLLRNAGGQWGDSFAYMTLNGLILGLYANTVRPDKGRTPLYNCTLTPVPPPPPPPAAAPAEHSGRRLHATGSVAAPATGGAADPVAAAGTGSAAASRRLHGMGEIGEVQIGRQLSPWFLSTDAKCEASGLLATRVGYIATWKVLADLLQLCLHWMLPIRICYCSALFNDSPEPMHVRHRTGPGLPADADPLHRARRGPHTVHDGQRLRLGRLQARQVPGLCALIKAGAANGLRKVSQRQQIGWRLLGACRSHRRYHILVSSRKITGISPVDWAKAAAQTALLPGWVMGFVGFRV